MDRMEHRHNSHTGRRIFSLNLSKAKVLKLRALANRKRSSRRRLVFHRYKVIRAEACLFPTAATIAPTLPEGFTSGFCNVLPEM